MILEEIPTPTRETLQAECQRLTEKAHLLAERLNLLTGRQARLICDAHIDDVLGDSEAEEALAMSNPKLLDAYYALHRYSVGAHTATRGTDQEKGTP